jgi:hypothetical protein
MGASEPNRRALFCLGPFVAKPLAAQAVFLIVMRKVAFKARGLMRRSRASAMRRNRHRCLLVAQMAEPGAPDQLVLVTNYAARGLALQALDPPQRGAAVTITIAYIGACIGQYEAIVRWRSARAFGVRVNDLIDVLELSLAKPGPQFTDYPLPHSPAFEGLYLHTAFRQGSLDAE